MNDIRKQFNKVLCELSEKESSAVEAFCLALMLEKGTDSVIDYELVRQTYRDEVRFFFRRRIVPYREP